jgi:hypothetical protein
MPAFPLQTKRNFRAAIGCAQCLIIATAVMIAPAPVRAQDDSIEAKVLDGIMGAIGLSRKGEDTINYRERSPLVLPQSNVLPPPESAKVDNPNWPVDPEVKQARALAAAERASNDGRTSSQIMDDNRRPLLRSEIEKGRTNKRQNNPNGGEEGTQRSSWSDLGYKGGIFGNMFGRRADDHPEAFTGEAPRTSLIQPPSGYQTPSPTQPYALAKDKYKPKAVDSYTERGTTMGK